MSYAAFSGSAVAEKETTTPTATIQGTGLITGLPVAVEIKQLPPNSGIVFNWLSPEGDVYPIPASLQSVVHTERGVTLAHPAGKTLSIVEHFLCGCALANQMDLEVTVKGAPELPLLDGSAIIWANLLKENLPARQPEKPINLKHAVFYRHNDDICIYAIPAESFTASYSVNFNHPELTDNWVSVCPKTDNGVIKKIGSAQTFGFLRELPVLQAQGLAKGVTEENTLGLTEDGGYTRPLKFDAEPIYHKILDLIGDLMLTGLNPLNINAHFYAINAGHGAHTSFGKQLLGALACE